MKRTVGALMIAGALMSWVAGPAVAQERTAGGRITVEYEPSVLLAVNAAVKREHVLEELQAFLAPLRLPRDLKITITDCGAVKSAYQSGQPVKICYELINQIADAAKKLYPTDEGQQDVVIVGAIIQACFHEVAFAIFDILQVPIWGRADDAADRLAALIMVALGEDIEKVAILGTSELFKWSATSGKTWTGSSFADTATPDAQRYFNYICIAAAADFPAFGGLVQNGTIPPSRAADCTHEFEQVRHAFDLRIMPFVDPDALVRVKATQWLEWTPGK
jgi:Putative metallopeptidase